MIARSAIFVTLACAAPCLIAAESERAIYVELDRADVGSLLKRAVEGEGSEIIATFFEDMPQDRKTKLYEELGKHTRLTIIERLVLNDKGKWVLDPRWTPAAIVKGQSGGILDAKRLGMEGECAFNVALDIDRPKIEDDGGRTALLGVKLRLAGEGLALKYPELQYSGFQWTLVYEASLEELEEAAKAKASPTKR